ncbi:MAG TPA: LysR family transcriptional regulator [Sphingomonas sp.]|nr:LysR family transcriptional regulator [Sphingomonas sp.]
MTLRSINLNLLPILQALLREASVSRAAAAVGMSQPAVSRALAQLRGIIGDPLLVRAGPGFRLSPRAASLRAEVDRVCGEVEGIWRPTTFDPALERREFVIASADYAPLLLLPALLPTLRESAPGVTLRFDEWRPADLVDPLRATEFVLGPVPLLQHHAAPASSSMALFSDSFVAVVAATHPLAARASPSAAEIDAFPHILFVGADAGDPTGLSEEAMIGRAPSNVVARVRHFAALPMLVMTTGAVTVMPRRLATIIGRDLPILVIDEAGERAPIEIGLAWPRRFEDDAAHRWFRTLVAEVLTRIDAD